MLGLKQNITPASSSSFTLSVPMREVSCVVRYTPRAWEPRSLQSIQMVSRISVFSATLYRPRTALSPLYNNYSSN